MKYLSVFATEAAYISAKSSLDLPHVSLVTADMSVKYDPYVAPVQD